MKKQKERFWYCKISEPEIDRPTGRRFWKLWTRSAARVWCTRRLTFQPAGFFCPYPTNHNKFKEENVWNFLRAQSTLWRYWLSRWALALACGALSTCWKVTATTTLARMLMYGKEASNRKQEIDRQHHTIPNQRNQRPKDKHCGNVHNWLWNHG